MLLRRRPGRELLDRRAARVHRVRARPRADGRAADRHGAGGGARRARRHRQRRQQRGRPGRLPARGGGAADGGRPRRRRSTPTRWRSTRRTTGRWSSARSCWCSGAWSPGRRSATRAAEPTPVAGTLYRATRARATLTSTGAYHEMSCFMRNKPSARTSTLALARVLEQARYEVLPTATTEEKVLTHLPRDRVVTITASPSKGLEATIDLAERLAGHGLHRRAAPGRPDDHRPHGARRALRTADRQGDQPGLRAGRGRGAGR